MAEKELAYKRKARLRGKNRKVRIAQVYDLDNLRRADHEARKGKDGPKKYHKGVRLFDKAPDRNLQDLSDDIRLENYHTSEGHECTRRCPCGKVRTLHKLPYYPDHIEHHALMQVIFPVMLKYYYHDSSASIKGKGMHFAQKRTEKYIRKHEYAGRIYFAKMDFVKFYHNIDQMKCYDVLAHHFSDRGIRYLIWEVLTACEDGLGIGLFPIQPMTNFYTSPICRAVMMQYDVWIEIYCDDIIIWGLSKKEVWKAVNYILGYARDKMEQKVHDGISVQVIDEKHPADFVGYQYFFDHTFIRKAMKKKFKRKMHRTKDPLKRYRTATSYKGWLKHCNGFRLWCAIMGMKSFKDLEVPKFEKLDADGHRMLEGTKVSASMIAEREVTFRDVETGVKSNFKKPAAIVQIEDNGMLYKFFTCNQGLIQTLTYCKENQMFPFRGKLHRQNPNAGLPDYTIV